MTTEEAIKYFSGAVNNKTVLYVAADMNKRVQAMVASVYEANELALIALQEKAEREDPKPLTIEELRQLDEEPVWVKPEGVIAGYGMWCVVNHNRLTRRVEALIPGIEKIWFEIEGYGERWTAYRHKPKEG